SGLRGSSRPDPRPFLIPWWASGLSSLAWVQVRCLPVRGLPVGTPARRRYVPTVPRRLGSPKCKAPEVGGPLNPATDAGLARVAPGRASRPRLFQPFVQPSARETDGTTTLPEYPARSGVPAVPIFRRTRPPECN